MILILVFIALLLLSARMSNKYKENIADTLAVCSAGLILLLYCLAFFRGLKLIGIISLIYILTEAVCVIRKKSGKEAFAGLRSVILICFVLTVISVTVLTSKEIFTWWDDINFWSSDAKQIFFMNGFPGKYGNVSPEFGDYPPVTSLFKWLFLQISPNSYNESYQFVGYFTLNLIFLMPLAGHIDRLVDKSETKFAALIKFMFFVTVIMLPGVFNGIIFYGTPADITMAIIYGALLLSIWEQEGHEKIFYYGRIAVYTSVLFLTKSVGFEWALFALIFYLVVAKKHKAILISIAVSATFYGSWLIFCLMNRRVAKLTGAGIKMASSGYSVPDNAADKMHYFLSGFLTMPMHADRNITLDLSSAAAVFIIFAVIGIIAYLKLIDSKETVKLILFLAITGLTAYGIIFLAHISIFQTEEQYLDAYAMAVSIARYCCPFTLGSTMLLTGILLDRVKASQNEKLIKRAVLIIVACVLMTADYLGIYRHLNGYRNTLSDDRAVIDDMVGDDGRELINSVSDERYWGKRILVIRDGHEYHWVHDAYISREASPVAMVYDGYLTESDTPEMISDRIRSSHAHYIYIEDSSYQASSLFEPLMESGQEYISGNVYRVTDTDQGIRLVAEH
ncbi:MAG: hypothetical protein J5525_07835 [Lachnospiraceae bacterium]|nr:hypothetical protein [Lachnospiraceae bacterium]